MSSADRMIIAIRNTATRIEGVDSVPYLYDKLQMSSLNYQRVLHPDVKAAWWTLAEIISMRLAEIQDRFNEKPDYIIPPPSQH